MKLELGKIFIKDIRFDDKTHVKDGVLYVNKEEVEKLVLEDDKLTGCHVDIAKPGESVRITPVKDVIEPRVKTSGDGGLFPGIISKVATVGSGRRDRKGKSSGGHRKNARSGRLLCSDCW